MTPILSLANAWVIHRESGREPVTLVGASIKKLLHKIGHTAFEWLSEAAPHRIKE